MNSIWRIMQTVWNETFRVHTYETDRLGNLSLPMLCGYLQESASLHANHLKWGYEDLGKQDQLWVLNAMWLKIHRIPHWQDEVQVATWPSGRQGLRYLRDFSVRDQQGHFCVSAATSWVIIDQEKRRPVRMNFEFEYPPREKICESRPGKIEVADSLDNVKEVQTTYDDLDIQNHVNNLRYIQWMMAAIPSDFRMDYDIDTFEINYLAETNINQSIQVLHRQMEPLQWVHELQNHEGKAVCRAVSQWKSVS